MSVSSHLPWLTSVLDRVALAPPVAGAVLSLLSFVCLTAGFLTTTALAVALTSAVDEDAAGVDLVTLLLVLVGLSASPAFVAAAAVFFGGILMYALRYMGSLGQMTYNIGKDG